MSEILKNAPEVTLAKAGISLPLQPHLKTKQCFSQELFYYMNKNSVIGWVLMGALLIVYLVYNQHQQESYLKEKAKQDSIAKLQQPAVDTNAAKAAPLAVPVTPVTKNTTAQTHQEYGLFAGAMTGTTQQTSAENKVITFTFSNKGGLIKSVVLKNYKTYGGDPLMLKGNDYDELALQFANSNTLPVNTGNLYFSLVKNDTQSDGTQVLVYHLNLPDSSRYLEYTYTLHPDEYMIDWHITMKGFNQIIPAQDNTLQLVWKNQANHDEMDIDLERRNVQVYFRDDKKDVDYFSFYKTKSKDITTPLQWVSFKQQFFNTTLIAPHYFSGANINGTLPGDNDSSNIVARSNITLSIPYNHTAVYNFPLKIYYGPNDYTILKSHGIGLENVVPLGYGIYAFVKYINKWIILPVFLLLGKLIGNWGIVIILLTIVLRVLISPLTYKSYVSQAKMKVLKPELDELKAKFKGDQQKFGVEQMKLYKSAGVSPLGGCVPMVLQIPIFFALYSLFMASIELRQQHFWWIKDLSTYDSIYHLPFTIPIYGDHVSLLTLLMTVTSIVMALYNRNMTMSAAGQDNPLFKYMPYVLPIFYLGFFNKMAAGLTLYYLTSNVITIAIQFVIQTFIIDDKKIHQQIQENKKRPVKQSRWQQRLEEVQKSQQAQKKR